jgi:predicted pyridoxine 5'-phosphate oxidase superfamily flavin-nucleotide-binding protein
MTRPISDIAFTPAVKAVQERFGSRATYARMEQAGGWAQSITPELAVFIAERDSFYLGTANADGQPYIQHRGGPAGFLKVLDERTLAFADFRGNKQYITVGTLAENDKAFIFLMDYAHRKRVKVWGRARVVEDDPKLLARLVAPDDKGHPERIIVFTVEAWDANCPQHIRPRHGADADAETLSTLQCRLDALEAENRTLRRQVAAYEQTAADSTPRLHIRTLFKQKNNE